MPYFFNQVKLSKKVKGLLSKARVPRVNGEDITRAVLHNRPKSGFNSARVSEAKSAKAEKISLNRIQDWVAAFDKLEPAEAWTVERFVEEFEVQGFDIEATLFDQFKEAIASIEDSIAKLSAGQERLKKQVAALVAGHGSSDGRVTPHPHAVRLRDRLKSEGFDVNAEADREKIIEALQELGSIDKQEVRRILLTDEPPPPDIDDPWNNVLVGMAYAFKKLTGRTYDPRSIAEIMAGAAGVSVEDFAEESDTDSRHIL